MFVFDGLSLEEVVLSSALRGSGDLKVQLELSGLGEAELGSLVEVFLKKEEEVLVLGE